MTREKKKLDVTEERPKSYEPSDHEQIKHVETNGGLEHNDQTKECVTAGGSEGRRLRHHSAPHRQAEGKSSSRTCQSLSKEERRSLSLPPGCGILPSCPSEWKLGGFPADHRSNRCNELDRETNFPASKSPRYNLLFFNENKADTEKLPQSGTWKKTKFDLRLYAGRKKLSKVTEGIRSSQLAKQLLSKTVFYNLLIDLIVISSLSAAFSCLALNHSICDLDHSFFYSKFEKGPLEISFNGTENITHGDLRKPSKAISVHYENKFTVWLNEHLYHISISAMHVTSTSIATQSHASVLDWGATLTHSQSMTETPTPPLPRVPSFLLDDPVYAVNVYSSSGESEDQCMGEAGNNDVLLAASFSASQSAVSETDCVAEPGMSLDQETPKIHCVHDCHEITMHCSLCNIWVCTYCSRVNFVPTMRKEQRKHSPEETATSFSSINSIPDNAGSSDTSGTGHEEPSHTLVLTWERSNGIQELVSLTLNSHFIETYRENQYDRTIDAMINNYKRITSAMIAFCAVLTRMTPSLTDTRFSFSRDFAFEYLNDHFLTDPFQSFETQQSIIHKDAMDALRITGASIYNLRFLTSIYSTYWTQLDNVKLAETSSSRVRRSDRTRTRRMRVTSQYSEPGAEKFLSDVENVHSEAQFSFLESEKDTTGHSGNRETTSKERQFQSNASNGFQSKTADSKNTRDASQVHTSEAWPRTCRETVTSQNEINPNSIETGSVYSGGARPKSKTRKKKITKV